MIEQFLIGTYTKKDSKGAYMASLDTSKGELTDVQLAIPSQKPAYLQVGPNQRVYAVKQDGDQAGVAVYSLANGQAETLSTFMEKGPAPAYVGLDEARHLLYSANYHTANVEVFKLAADGKLTRTDVVTHQGETGPEPEQEAPHVHYADLTPDQRLIVCDLGMDLVVVYDVSNEGKLTAVSRFKFEPGFGTRHLIFHPNGQYVYVLGELSSKLAVLKYNAADASFEHLQTIKQSGCLQMANSSTHLTGVKTPSPSLQFSQTLRSSTSNPSRLRVTSPGTSTSAATNPTCWLPTRTPIT